MNRKNIIICTLAILSAAGCLPKEENNLQYVISTVTVKPMDNGQCYFKSTDSTALVAANYSKYPFDSSPEKRVVISYTTDFTPSKAAIPGFHRTYDINLLEMDTLYTKRPVVSLGSAEEDDKAFGNDPLSIYFDGVFPPTSLEDGYLTISFSFLLTGLIAHEVNLVTGVNPEDPYEVEFRHNAYGDLNYSQVPNTITFPLQMLPDTEGKTVDITLKWNSFVTGKTESVKFPYRSRTDWPVQ